MVFVEIATRFPSKSSGEAMPLFGAATTTKRPSSGVAPNASPTTFVSVSAFFIKL